MQENKSKKINFKKIKIVFGMDADKDWQFVTIISLLTTVCGAAFGLWVYFSFAYFSNQDIVEGTPSNFLDKSKIQDILEENQRKETEFNRIRSGL